MTQATPITVAYGDGIGPEIMAAALRVLQAAGAKLELEVIEIGEKVYTRGFTSGIEPSAWESLRRTKVFYKAPITTPQGSGYKSLNVTIRKTLGLYANVRPCTAYYPFVQTKHPLMKVTIIRENEEDLYAGIEHRQTREVYQCLKLITHPGSEKIIRYAFEYARRNNRRKVTCFTKDNIMKFTDGVFHKLFDQIAAEYPDLESEHMIIDIGTARLADHPEQFDVIVLPNLYGDILSDVAAQLSGSVGLGPSANIGEEMAMFEAIHGSAPDIAGKGIANPSGLLLAGVMMLVHIGQPDIAARVHNAWKCAIEDGVHTGDIYDPDVSKQRASMEEFTGAIIERLGKKPRVLRVIDYGSEPVTPAKHKLNGIHAASKALVGVDVFLDWDADGRNPNTLGRLLGEQAAGDGLKLQMITNRGQKVYPDGLPETFCTDHWRCRFVAEADDAGVTHQQVINLLQRVCSAGLDFIKTEHLYTFDGVPGYSLGQGQ